MTTTTIHNVPDMSCQHCIDAITKEVSAVEDVVNVSIDLNTKTVTVAGGKTEAIKEAIDQAGFDIAD